MAHIDTETKRAILRDIAWAAEENLKTLKDALRDYLRGRVREGGASGRFINSTSGAGHSSSFGIQDVATRTALGDELYTRYEEAVAYLELTPQGNEHDAAILAEMMRCLVPNAMPQLDFSGYQT